MNTVTRCQQRSQILLAIRPRLRAGADWHAKPRFAQSRRLARHVKLIVRNAINQLEGELAPARRPARASAGREHLCYESAATYRPSKTLPTIRSSFSHRAVMRASSAKQPIGIRWFAGISPEKIHVRRVHHGPQRLFFPIAGEKNSGPRWPPDVGHRNPVNSRFVTAANVLRNQNPSVGGIR